MEHVNTTNSEANNNSDIEAFAQIDVERWGVIHDFETEGEIFYSSERNGNTFTIKTYDNDIEVLDDFSIDVPESANQIEVIDHHSTQFFTENATNEFLVYLHYFDDENPGPEGQIFEIWVIESDGTIVEQMTGTNAEAKLDAEGNHKLYTYFNDETSMTTINAYDVTTWEVDNSYTIDSELINYFMGVPFSFMDVDGEEYIVIAHYESLFMDNATLEVYPDNKLIVKLLNFDLEEQKIMELDIDSRYPDAGEFVAPMATFGQFYRDHTYDISSDIFNADSQLEIVYGIQYYDMIADNEWSTYLVANEDGEMIHELNEYLIDSYTDMMSIEGQDNQLAFLMGEDGMATNLGFFDIESWSFQKIFTAEYYGDILSNKFNRIPAEDSYHFLISLGEPDEEDGNTYGVVNEYTADGQLHNRQRFTLPENIQLFTPVLTPYALIPNLFTEENDDLHYMYLYKEQSSDGPIFNNLVFSKGLDDILVEFRGDTSAGNIVGSTFLTDGNGTFDKMTIQYESPNDALITDFYRLPFTTTLGTEDLENIQFAFYPNPTDGQVKIDASEPVKFIQVVRP